MPYTQTYASSSDVLLQRRTVEETVEVAAIKHAKLISCINKQNKMSALRPSFFVIVPALVAVNWQCWLKSSVLISAIIDLTSFPPMLPCTCSRTLLHLPLFYFYALSLNFSGT